MTETALWDVEMSYCPSISYASASRGIRRSFAQRRNPFRRLLRTRKTGIETNRPRATIGRKHEDRGILDLDGAFSAAGGSAYGGNPLNQLTHLGFGGRLDIVGNVAGTNGPFTVKVDGENAALFNQTNFWGGGRIKAGSNTISIVSTDASTNRTISLRRATFPPTNPQQLTWDLNGNMTSDSQRTFTWNEENKLVAIECGSGAPVALKKRSEFAYDAQSRMFERKDLSGWTNNVYSITNKTRYVRDGYRIIAEITETTTNFNIWGLDLSQSRDGAGGIGGLLAVHKLSTNSSQPATYFPCYDGNGNITDYIDTNGTVVAHREYDPFGRTIASSGPMKDNFTFWFSTKPFDSIWGLIPYEFRTYDPSQHIFLSRDPIGEKGGGIGLYGFCENNPIMWFDPWGLFTCDELKAIRDSQMNSYRQALNDAIDAQNALSSVGYLSAGRTTASWAARLFGGGAAALSGLWYVGAAVSAPTAGTTVSLVVPISSIGAATIATGISYTSGSLMASAGVSMGRWAGTVANYLTGQEMNARIQAIQDSLNIAVAAINSALAAAQAAQAKINADPCCK